MTGTGDLFKMLSFSIMQSTLCFANVKILAVPTTTLINNFLIVSLVPVMHLLSHLPLFWKSHCATCSPVYVILYHVAKYRSIISQRVFFFLEIDFNRNTKAESRCYYNNNNNNNNNKFYWKLKYMTNYITPPSPRK